MQYSTIQYVKSALHIQSTTDDALLDRFVEAASRSLDNLCARSVNASGYFELQDVVDEQLVGKVDAQGHLIFWPHKVKVQSVSALAYRSSPSQEWTDFDPTKVVITRSHTCEAWTLLPRPSRGYFVKVSYTGGFSASPASLPADFVEIATLLAGRLYRESESGMNDAIGISELSTLSYTKALPQRVKEMIKPYIRQVPW